MGEQRFQGAAKEALRAPIKSLLNYAQAQCSTAEDGGPNSSCIQTLVNNRHQAHAHLRLSFLCWGSQVKTGQFLSVMLSYVLRPLLSS